MTSLTNYSSMTSLTNYSPMTSLTNYSPMTALTNYSSMTSLTNYSPVTSLTNYSPMTYSPHHHAPLLKSFAPLITLTTFKVAAAYLKTDILYTDNTDNIHAKIEATLKAFFEPLRKYFTTLS